MKNFLKKQNGVSLIAIIIVIVFALVGSVTAFLGVRMLVADDGKFLKPFEDLGWIDPDDDEKNEDDEDEDDDEDDEDKKQEKNDKDVNNDKKTDKKSNIKSSEYLVDESKLSSDSKKSGVKHYYAKISLTDEIEDEEEFADLYNLMDAAVNIYAKDGKAIEIVFGFDVTKFCEEAFKKMSTEFSAMGISNAEDLQDMMMSVIESGFDMFDEDNSEFITKYIDDGKLQLYITEKGFKELYDEYNIKDNNIDEIVKAFEEEFKTKMTIVD